VPLLRATGLSKRYGPVQALDDVDLVVERGEVVALVGENGSGKSTLSRIVCGATAPDTGTLELDGTPLAPRRPRDALDAGIVLVSQEPTAVPHLSVAENVLLPRLQRLGQRVRSRELFRDAAPFLQRVGLDVDPALPLGRVRPGDRELVEVAKALAAAPRLLVLDEVTTRLPDPETLFAVVDQLVADGLGVVVITHRLREIRRTASRAVVLRDGRLVAELERSELTDARLSSAMVGRDLGAHPRRPAPSVAGPVVLQADAVVTDRGPSPVTLQVRAGEVVGLAGLVGSGRSELLETLAGARRARGGTVQVAGTPVRAGSPRAALQAGAVLVPEDRFAQALVRPASVAANLSLPYHRLGRRSDRRLERRRAAHAVAAFGIRCADSEAPVMSLSGGNAQKVVIARCLGLSPKVLLLDEPTRGVDVGARAEIYALVERAVAGGTGVLVASSDLPELLGLSDRVIVLHDGEVAGELSRDEATEEAVTLLSAGGGRSAA
jgi:ribose transport system ATP-binding protein